MEKCRVAGWDVMLSLTGRREPIGDGVKATDNGRGDNIPGEAESQGKVFGLW